MKAPAFWPLAVVVLSAATFHACSSSPSAGTTAPDRVARGGGGGGGASQREQLSYGVGFYLGEEVREGLKTDGLEGNLDLIARGFADGLNARPPIMAREDLDEVLRAVHQEMEKRMVQRLLEEDSDFRALHDGNLARSRSWLEAHGKEAGVATLPEGVQYRVLTSGSGRSVPPDGTVTVRFRGTLIDGTEFAQADRAELRVAAMMPGGRAAATRMRAGDHWQVAIPPELAFGPAGNPPLVGPNEVLLFDVEVLDVRSSS